MQSLQCSWAGPHWYQRVAEVARQLSQPFSPSEVRGTSMEAGREVGMVPDDTAFPVGGRHLRHSHTGRHMAYPRGLWAQQGLLLVCADELSPPSDRSVSQSSDAFSEYVFHFSYGERNNKQTSTSASVTYLNETSYIP